jgi:hypothetical protein
MADALVIRLVTQQQPATLAELTGLAADSFGELAKAVVDVEQRIMAVGGELHADEEQLLLEGHDSRQANLWGINLYPAEFGEDGFIEYDSMVNVRPRQQNRSRSVEDPAIRQLIASIVSDLVKTDG